MSEPHKQRNWSLLLALTELRNAILHRRRRNGEPATELCKACLTSCA